MNVNINDILYFRPLKCHFKITKIEYSKDYNCDMAFGMSVNKDGTYNPELHRNGTTVSLDSQGDFVEDRGWTLVYRQELKPTNRFKLITEE